MTGMKRGAVLLVLGALALATDRTLAPGTPGGSDGPTPPPPAQTAVTDPEADSLIGRWIDALGGMETYHDFRSARYTLTTELYDTLTGRLRRARPRYVALAKMNGEELARIERWEGDDFIVQGFDGDTAWAYMNGDPVPPDGKDAEEAIYVTRDVFYWFSLPFKLRDPGVNLHYEGRDGSGRHTVRVTFGPDVGEHQDTWWYYFEEGRSWPVEVAYREEGQDNVNRTRWEDLRTVDGYVHVGQRVHFDDRGRVPKILRASDVILNPDLSARTFSDPAASPWPGEDG